MRRPPRSQIAEIDDAVLERFAGNAFKFPAKSMREPKTLSAYLLKKQKSQFKKNSYDLRPHQNLCSLSSKFSEN